MVAYIGTARAFVAGSGTWLSVLSTSQSSATKDPTSLRTLHAAVASRTSVHILRRWPCRTANLM